MKLFLFALLVSSNTTLFAQDIDSIIDSDKRVVALREKLAKKIIGNCANSVVLATEPALRFERLIGIESFGLSQIVCYGKATYIADKKDNRYAEYSALMVTIDVNYKVMKNGKVKVTGVDKNEIIKDIFVDLKSQVEEDNKKLEEQRIK